MKLTSQAILEFQSLYQKLFNIEISPEDAMQYGQNLIEIITTLLN